MKKLKMLFIAASLTLFSTISQSGITKLTTEQIYDLNMLSLDISNTNNGVVITHSTELDTTIVTIIIFRNNIYSRRVELANDLHKGDFGCNMFKVLKNMNIRTKIVSLQILKNVNTQDNSVVLNYNKMCELQK